MCRAPCAALEGLLHRERLGEHDVEGHHYRERSKDPEVADYLVSVRGAAGASEPEADGEEALAQLLDRLGDGEDATGNSDDDVRRVRAFRRNVRRRLPFLPPLQREVIERLLRGQRQREIAAQLGRTKECVCIAYRRARVNLAKPLYQLRARGSGQLQRPLDALASVIDARAVVDGVLGFLHGDAAAIDAIDAVGASTRASDATSSPENAVRESSTATPSPSTAHAPPTATAPRRAPARQRKERPMPRWPAKSSSQPSPAARLELLRGGRSITVSCATEADARALAGWLPPDVRTTLAVELVRAPQSGAPTTAPTPARKRAAAKKTPARAVMPSPVPPVEHPAADSP